MMKEWKVEVEIRYYSEAEAKHFRHNYDDTIRASNAGVAARRGIAFAFDDLRDEVEGRKDVENVTVTVERSRG